MKKILIVFGTRPEAIKMVPLVKEFIKYPNLFLPVVCVTGQHREMLDQVMHIFGIKPDYDLNIMKQGQDLFDITSETMLGLRTVLEETKPDLVLVHGDTTTSVSAAMAAFYKQIPVGHVEAGLRSHNMYSPWPEEINRQTTSRITTFHFAPTVLSRDNLLREDLPSKKIHVTGNTVIDALYLALKNIEALPQLKQQQEIVLQNSGLPSLNLKKWKSGERRMVLITGHRRENFGQGFINIGHAISSLATKYPDTDFVYPVHLNPNVQKPILEILKNKENVFLISPLEYLPFVYLMKLSFLILTDSGGIQEEAPSLGKPVLVMRDTTERPEAVEAGAVMLVGADYNSIKEKVSVLLDNKAAYSKMSKSVNPYGDGKASERIVNYLKENIHLY